MKSPFSAGNVVAARRPAAYAFFPSSCGTRRVSAGTSDFYAAGVETRGFAATTLDSGQNHSGMTGIFSTHLPRVLLSGNQRLTPQALEKYSGFAATTLDSALQLRCPQKERAFFVFNCIFL